MDGFALSDHEPKAHNKLAVFAKAKKQACENFQEIKNCLNNVKNVYADFQERRKRQGNFLDEETLKAIHAAQEQVDKIYEALKRNYMKIVFFGRTSNGKSTVINAMLHGSILPASMGKTTTSFIEVRGSKEDKATVIPRGSRDSKIVELPIKSPEDLRKTLSELNKQHEFIDISWPCSKCHLLQEEIRLVDCPGYNDSFNMDQKLDKLCQDADVFVLVIDAGSSLSELDEKYFIEVSRLMAMPNIFILFNCWDKSIDEEVENPEEVKQHHMSRATDLLINKLQVEEGEVKNRIFFVSAREVLAMRMGKTVEKKECQRRLRDFETFESKVKTCVSETAVETKFKARVGGGLVVMKRLRPVLEDLCKIAESKVKDEQTKLNDIKNEVEEAFKDMENDIQRTLNEVEKAVTSSLQKQLQEKRNLNVDFFYSLNSEKMEEYKESLDAFEKELKERLLQEIGKYILVFRQKVESNLHVLADLYQRLCTDFAGKENFQMLPVKTFAENLDVFITTGLPLTDELWSSFGAAFISKLSAFVIDNVFPWKRGMNIRRLIFVLRKVFSTFFDPRKVREKMFQQQYMECVLKHAEEFTIFTNSVLRNKLHSELSNAVKHLKTKAEGHFHPLVAEMIKTLDQELKQLLKWRTDFYAIDKKLRKFQQEYLK